MSLLSEKLIDYGAMSSNDTDHDSKPQIIPIQSEDTTTDQDQDPDYDAKELEMKVNTSTGRESRNFDALDVAMPLFQKNSAGGFSAPGVLPDMDHPAPGDEDLPELGIIDRAVSLDTGIEIEKKKEELLKRPSVLSVRQVSIEVLKAEHREGLGPKAKLDTVAVTVPPRDVLVRMPLFSTPLTLESTNNAFRDFISRLNEMGFTEQSEAALVMTSAESVESAVEYIMDNPEALWHRFVAPKDDGEVLEEAGGAATNDQLLKVVIQEDSLCHNCGLPYKKHLIDHEGEKVLKGVEADDSLPGDLAGRVSMSVATQQERTEQKKLQQVIAERLKSLAEEPDDEIITKALTAGSAAEAGLSTTLASAATDELKVDGPTQRCMVCFDDKAESDFGDAPCGHNYCRECLQNHYRIKTQDADVLKIGCIDPKCDREIPEEEFKLFLTDPELIKKYEKFRKTKLAMLNPSARFCSKADCEGTMFGSRWTPKLECPVCKMQICFNCSQPWHGYFVGCNANVDLQYSKWAINKDVQKCPKCRVRIEKAEGCNHMTCQSCKYEFCWICRGPYSGDHFEWWNLLGCPGAQYTPRFCRCPTFFPRWLNRLLIVLCFLAVVVPVAITIGIFWMIIICLVFCVRCDTSCDIDPCDCID